MSFLQRRTGLTLLALLVLVAPLSVLAQEDAIRIDGSRIVADIMEPVSTTFAEETGTAVNLEISGTSNGLTRLCNGEIDIATAARPITREEEQACADNDTEWVEVLLGFDAAAVVANPTFTRTECLSFSDLSALYGISATEAVTSLSNISPALDDIAFVLYAPPTGSNAYNLLDDLLPGDGLRIDLVTQEASADVLSMVADDVAGLGFAPLSDVLASDAVFNTVALDNMSGAGCVAPTQETLEDGSYPGAQGLFLYVNAASLANEAVGGLVNAALTEDAQTVVADSGFVPTSSSLTTKVAENVEAIVTGREFSQGEPLYAIPLDVSGSVSIGTAAAAYDATTALTDAFVASYPDTAITVSGTGNVATQRGICDGTLDLAVVTRGATDEESALCADNGITLWEAELGSKAIVMVVAAEAEYAACLTTDQVASLWQSAGEDTITNWSQLGDEFPDLAVTIFAPRNNQSAAGFILGHASDHLLAPRTDALEQDNDALYRAAATANVEGAVSYMTYGEYLASDADVVAVSIDAGDGCVAPSEDAVVDGSYVLSDSLTFLASETALARPEVQAVVWYAIQNSIVNLLTDAGLVGVDASAFEAYQESAVEQFGAAAAQDTSAEGSGS